VRALLVEALTVLTPIASYVAWIKHNGTYSTKSVGYRCWNTELIENANLALALDWTSLDSKIATGINCCLSNIRTSLDNVIGDAIGTWWSEATDLMQDTYNCHQTPKHLSHS
jgi:hypothetical protein